MVTNDNFAQYKGIYVTRDETAEQQAISKRKREEYARKKQLEAEMDDDEEEEEYVSFLPRGQTNLAMRKRRREFEQSEDMNTSRPANCFMRANLETTPITSKKAE